MRPLKVYGFYHWNKRTGNQCRCIVAAPTKAAVGRLMRLPPAQLHNLSETGDPEEVPIASAKPGTVFQTEGMNYPRTYTERPLPADAPADAEAQPLNPLLPKVREHINESATPEHRDFISAEWAYAATLSDAKLSEIIGDTDSLQSAIRRVGIAVGAYTPRRSEVAKYNTA